MPTANDNEQRWPEGAPFDVDLGGGYGGYWFDCGLDHHIALMVYHRCEDRTKHLGGWCIHGVFWERPEGYDGPVWQRTGDDEHLTISPSILCLICKDHGYIRGGKWERA